MVVQTGDGALAGIVSERDVVRQLHQHGAQLLGWPVEKIMTRDVATCGPGDAIEDVMRLMTDRRLRHVPVIVDGSLGGIVSIGDLVKSRIDDFVTTTRIWSTTSPAAEALGASTSSGTSPTAPA